MNGRILLKWVREKPDVNLWAGTTLVSRLGMDANGILNDKENVS